MSTEKAGSGFDRAIVIGASMAGLLAARVLSQHFAEVVVVERDELCDNPDHRKGVPQGRHAHALLCQGQAIMAELFPGLFEDLVAGGAQRVDMGAQAAWLHFGKWKARHRSGLASYYQSRPFLEWKVRQRVKAIANVRFIRGDVVRLLAAESSDKIGGALIRPRGDAAVAPEPSPMYADLVADASGRASHMPRWLEELGYEKPRESQVRINGGYATRLYRRPATVPFERQVVILYPNPPYTCRIGYIFPIEGDRWLVTLGSRFADYPPTDEDGFLAYAKSLDAPDIYDAIRVGEPLSDIVGNRFKANRWRHYEQLARFPQGLVVMGDALCSFNPAYGQGMTTCALEAQALDMCLGKAAAGGTRSARVLADRFRRQAGDIVKTPWLLATSEDFRYAQTEGKRPFWMSALTWYTRKIHQRSALDSVVYGAFLRVMQMVDPPTRLFRLSIVRRIFSPAGVAEQSTKVALTKVTSAQPERR